MFDVQVIEESISISYISIHIFIRELAEWFIAVSLKLIWFNRPHPFESDILCNKLLLLLILYMVFFNKTLKVRFTALKLLM